MLHIFEDILLQKQNDSPFQKMLLIKHFKDNIFYFCSRSLKLDLLSSIFQGLYPTEQDCVLIRKFLSCPASLEEKYSMIR